MPVYIDLEHNRRDRLRKESNFGDWVPSKKAAILIFTAVEGWGEKENIFTKRVGDGQKEGEGWKLGNETTRLSRPSSLQRRLWLQIKHGRLNKRSQAS